MHPPQLSFVSQLSPIKSLSMTQPSNSSHENKDTSFPFTPEAPAAVLVSPDRARQSDRENADMSFIDTTVPSTVETLDLDPAEGAIIMERFNELRRQMDEFKRTMDEQREKRHTVLTELRASVSELQRTVVDLDQKISALERANRPFSF